MEAKIQTRYFDVIGMKSFSFQKYIYGGVWNFRKVS